MHMRHLMAMRRMFFYFGLFMLGVFVFHLNLQAIDSWKSSTSSLQAVKPGGLAPPSATA
jgi:hypothetical protein